MPITLSHTYNIGIDIHLTQFSLVPRHTQTQNNHYIFPQNIKNSKPYIQHWYRYPFGMLFISLNHCLKGSIIIIMTIWQNHHPKNAFKLHLHCLFNSLFRLTTKEISKPCIAALCEGNLQWPINSINHGSVMCKVFPSRDIIMTILPYEILSNL